MALSHAQILQKGRQPVTLVFSWVQTLQSSLLLSACLDLIIVIIIVPVLFNVKANFLFWFHKSLSKLMQLPCLKFHRLNCLVVLDWGPFSPQLSPGDNCQHLETFLVVSLRERGYCWHCVGRGQKCYSISYHDRTENRSATKTHSAQNVNRLRLRNPELDHFSSCLAWSSSNKAMSHLIKAWEGVRNITLIRLLSTQNISGSHCP